MKRIIIFTVIVFFIMLLGSGIAIGYAIDKMQISFRPWHLFAWLGINIGLGIIVFVAVYIIERKHLHHDRYTE